MQFRSVGLARKLPDGLVRPGSARVKGRVLKVDTGVGEGHPDRCSALLNDATVHGCRIRGDGRRDRLPAGGAGGVALGRLKPPSDDSPKKGV